MNLSNDLGTNYKYDSNNVTYDRSSIHEYFNWIDDRPLIAVYSTSWFDYPHVYGELFFTDVVDWIQTTFKTISEIRHFHWLLRPHPCDAWYKYYDLKKALPSVIPNHIGLAPLGWDGNEIENSVDALVTLYGTAGLEYASIGKPVLVASQGWYGHVGFVQSPTSRDEYLKLLPSKWWLNLDLQKSIELSNLFAGWHFAVPSWQENLIMYDDSKQDDIYEYFPMWLQENQRSIKDEILQIRKWFKYSNNKSYHTFKIVHSQDFSIPSYN